MPNEEILNEQIETATEETADTDYITAIQNLKATTVSKDDYNKLQDEHKKLLNAYIEGTDYDGADLKKEKEKPDLKAIEQRLFTNDCELNNLEYVELSLAHRNQILEQTGVDEYVPRGDQYVPTQEDFDAANRVAEAFQYCIDYAEGDSEVFTNELQRIMIDANPNPKAKAKANAKAAARRR